MAWMRSPEKVLLARVGARHGWHDAAGALPLVASALLWAWVVAGVLGPLGRTMSALEAPVALPQPARAAMIACAPPDEPSGPGERAAARLRHR